MKNSGFKTPSYEEAIEKRFEAQTRALIKKEARKNREKKDYLVVKIKHQTTLNKEEGFKKIVRDRDGDRCQFPDCTVVQIKGQLRIVDVHHIAPRSRRKDLICVPENGVCLCNGLANNHHQWCHDNPLKAIEMGLLSDRSRELAEKEGTLGQY